MRLLEAVPELGRALAGEERDDARRNAIVPAVPVAAGSWSPEALGRQVGVRGEVLGVLVLEGAITMHARIGRRPCIRLIGRHDCVLIGNRLADSLPIELAWSALSPGRVAILDYRLLAIARRWPALHVELLRRAGRQTYHGLVQQAISQLPRVAERLLALFWVLADGYGIDEDADVRVPLTITHETLAGMIGAQRPTVSLGLADLAREQLLRSDADGWLLARASLPRFDDPELRAIGMDELRDGRTAV